jgi:hypothetical protein
MKKIFLNLVLATFVLGAIATPSYAQQVASSKVEALKVVQDKKEVNKVVQQGTASKPSTKKVHIYTCTQVTVPQPEDSGTIGIFRKRPRGPGA